ncbi:MAG: hypothetical protein ABIF77_07680 [bacterium]
MSGTVTESAPDSNRRTELQCPLCGYRFDPARERHCSACPLHSGCGIVCCPHCSYGFLPPRQRSAGWLSRLWRKTWRRIGARG